MSEHMVGVHIAEVLKHVPHKRREETNFLVIHCADTRKGQDFGARDIREWHLKRGWADIGYHYVIRRNGTIERGRKIMDVGAHVEGYNSESIGICMVGKETNYEAAQWKSLRSLVTVLKRRFPTADVVGHRDLDPTRKAYCPGFDAEEWFAKNVISRKP